jgi:GH15 family glucan-1,4-alpha-glucosidase
MTNTSADPVPKPPTAPAHASEPTPARNPATSLRGDGYLPLEDYGVIGDGRTLALVGRDGSIDWMCLPGLDGMPALGALLDPTSGGRLELRPSVPFAAEQAYRERTNILETTFITDGGRVRVTDALLLDVSRLSRSRMLVRRVDGLAGTVPIAWRFSPGSALGGPAFQRRQQGGAHILAREDLLLGLSSWDAGASPDGDRGELSLEQGHSALIALSAAAAAPLPMPGREELERGIEETAQIWRAWISHCTLGGPWSSSVERSLLALRLLTDERTGAIAAAGTTSLPETVGGSRNFDYRFGWVRDASFALEALIAAGCQELSHAAIGWLLGSLGRTAPRVDPVYTLDGAVVRSQQERPAPGYRHSTPVLTGNQAGRQLQLGGWGDLLESACSYVRAGHVLPAAAGERLADSVDLLCRIWRREDAGLWELSQSAQYGTSKLGCWTAVDRLLELARRGQAPARHIPQWTEARAQMASYIERELYSESRRSYLRRAGAQDELDCGMLLAARRRFGDPAGERITGTVRAVREELSAGGALLYRYSGMQEQENAFLACSFWLVEALALGGRRDQAAELMDELCGLGGPTGLLSEEIEPGSRALRGNLPQALSHLSLINAAAAIGT